MIILHGQHSIRSPMLYKYVYEYIIVLRLALKP